MLMPRCTHTWYKDIKIKFMTYYFAVYTLSVNLNYQSGDYDLLIVEFGL